MRQRGLYAELVIVQRFGAIGQVVERIDQLAGEGGPSREGEPARLRTAVVADVEQHRVGRLEIDLGARGQPAVAGAGRRRGDRHPRRNAAAIGPAGRGVGAGQIVIRHAARPEMQVEGIGRQGLRRGIVAHLVVVPIAQAADQLELVRQLVFVLREEGEALGALGETDVGVIAIERRRVLGLVIARDDHPEAAEHEVVVIRLGGEAQFLRHLIDPGILEEDRARGIAQHRAGRRRAGLRRGVRRAANPGIGLLRRAIATLDIELLEVLVIGNRSQVPIAQPRVNAQRGAEQLAIDIGGAGAGGRPRIAALRGGDRRVEVAVAGGAGHAPEGTALRCAKEFALTLRIGAGGGIGVGAGLTFLVSL